MSFPVHTIDTAPPASQPTMIKIAEEFGAVPRAVALLASSPELLNGFLAASRAFEQTTLEPVVREVVILTVAVRNGCQVCIAMHSSTLRALGRTDLITPLRANEPLHDQQLESARIFVHQLLDHSGAVSEQQLQGFLAAGYTERNALEIVYGIGTYTMSTLANRLVRAEAHNR